MGQLLLGDLELALEIFNLLLTCLAKHFPLPIEYGHLGPGLECLSKVQLRQVVFPSFQLLQRIRNFLNNKLLLIQLSLLVNLSFHLHDVKGILQSLRPHF